MKRIESIQSFRNQARGMQMKWKKYRLKTTTQAEDIVSSILIDLGVEGVEIEDKIPLSQADAERMFVDILPKVEVDDGVAYLNFYLEEVDEELLRNIAIELQQARAYVDVGDCTIESSETEDIDWINNWKQYFHQFYIDEVLITPSWEPVQEVDKEKLVVQIDPGTAFGTGLHETTRLCVRQLKKYVKQGDEVLDVGCGSGILGMLALKFGARYVVGTDLDPCAIEATHENMKRNDIATTDYEVMIGNVIDDIAVQDKVGYNRYDLVLANILAEVLMPLTPVILRTLKAGGIYITSGIIAEKESVITQMIQAEGLELLEVTREGEWVSVTARKRR